MGSIEFIELGVKGKDGNLLGISPTVCEKDYFNESSFHKKLHSYLLEAKKRGWINVKTIAVFPENIGSWLFLMDEKVNDKKTFFDASKSISGKDSQNLFEQLAACIELKSKEIGKTYTNVFSALSKEFKLTIVAGSTLISKPRVVDSTIYAGEGKLENISAVFDKCGKIIAPLIKKVNIVNYEIPFLKEGSIEDLSPIMTEIGSIKILICADSWYDSCYSSVENCRAVLVLSYLIPQGIWEHPWKGYSGKNTPEAVDISDIGKITEGDAWEKYALIGKCKKHKVKHAINVFLHGKLFDFSSDGRSTVVNNEKIVTASSHDATIICSWF